MLSASRVALSYACANGTHYVTEKPKKLYLYDFPEHSQEEGCLQDTNMTDADVSSYYERIKKFVKLQSNCNTCRVSQKGKNT